MSASLRIVLLCICACLLQQTSAQEQTERIVGGQVTTIDKVPYAMSIRKDNRHFCGGTLVTTTHIVSAAHCVKLTGYTAAQMKVVGGATMLNGNGVSRNVRKVIFPAGYSATTRNMDIMVLALAAAMTGPNIAPIPLCSSDWVPGDSIQVSGWGLTSQDGDLSQQVRTVFLPLISKGTCVSQYAGRQTLTDTMFCAQTPGKDSCSGDSGGPVVFKNELCGVVSWGEGCANANAPGVYTSIKRAQTFLGKALVM